MPGTADRSKHSFIKEDPCRCPQLCSLEFAGNTVEEMAGQIRRFARDVIPEFPDKA